MNWKWLEKRKIWPNWGTIWTFSWEAAELRNIKENHNPG
jgi:hypothetical protein